MDSKVKFDIIERDWQKFARRYRRKVDRNADFQPIERPIDFDTYYCKMFTYVFGMLSYPDVELARIKKKKELKEYIRVKKLMFLFSLINFFHHSLQNLEILEQYILDGDDRFEMAHKFDYLDKRLQKEGFKKVRIENGSGKDI